MKKFLLGSFFCLAIFFSYAGRVSGIITDTAGQILPFASIQVKGTVIGTNANNEGKYFIYLQPGTYTLVCQYVGYKTEEKTIIIGSGNITIDFRLQIQQLILGEVIITQRENTAYKIIRNAIKKRSYYQNQVKEFQCEVYTKGQLKLRNYPKKVFGKKIDLETGDTSKRQMIYLSETIALYSVRQPAEEKIEVISTKVSGQNEGFGFSAPHILSFYDNNIKIGTNLNPRGFISPIADNALSYYRYKYEGSFFEGEKKINRIRVIPRRKYEPLFSGLINIVEDEWRIHSIKLMLTKESQMQFVDTLRIEELYVPVTNEIWFMKSQVVYPAVKLLGFDAYGSFVNIYSSLNIKPKFEKNFFNNTILKYEENANRKDSVYWETARPLPLLEEEVKDYKRKDSLALARVNPRYSDSVDKKRNKFLPIPFLLSGHVWNRQRTRTSISIPSLIEIVKYNTVEGWVINPEISYFKRIDTGIGRRSFLIRPNLRYGLSNHHFNAFGTFTYNYGRNNANAFNFSAGKRVFQFNNNSLQGERGATFSALLFERNRRKIYEAWYGRIRYEKTWDEGFNGNITLQYQDRLPLQNTSFYTWKHRKISTFTPNYPEQFNGPAFVRHQAVIASLILNWQPGGRYIEFPGDKVSIGSKYPTFSFTYTKGINKVLGSDVDYDKWRFGISDDLNLKLVGSFNYRFSTGGFLNRKKVQIPDYFHLNGNLSVLSTSYLNGFQLVPHYKYSNTERLMTTAFIEHHFNGFLTNKIPGFRLLNWFLEIGSNAFYVNKNFNYFEVFGGIENIFKIVRLDFVQGYLNGKRNSMGFRIGISGITGGKVED